jgi:hypothetical protein
MANSVRARLRQQLIHHQPVHVGQPEIAPLKPVGQLCMIKAQQVQDRCVQIVHVHRVCGDVEAQGPA